MTMPNSTQTQTLTMAEVVDIFASIGLDYTPGGEWVLDTNNKKQAIDAQRTDALSWEDYPSDNMARTFLKHQYLVIDIDGVFSHATDTHIHLTSGTTLPLTFYSVTSDPTKIHAYYSLPEDIMTKIPNRVIDVVESKVDTFVYGTLFEGHTLKNYEIHQHPIASLDSHPIVDTLLNLPHTQSSHHGELYPTTSPKSVAAVNALMAIDDFNDSSTTKEVNKALRILLPKKHIPKGSKKLIQIPISYTLINDMATKLMCVSELSTQDVELFIRFYIEKMHNLNPDYNNLLKRQIMATLPNRDAIELFNPDYCEGFTQLFAKQPGTSTPVFKTGLGGKILKLAYIQIDKITLEPVPFQDSFLLDRKVVESLNTERIIYDEEGVPRGWDDNLPVIENITCPYSEQTGWSASERPVINLYTKTEYQKQSTPKELVDLTSNIIMRFIYSVVPEEHIPYVLRYYAYVMFSQKPPLTTLWMSSPNAGAGKSILTVELFSKLIGTAAISAKANNVVKSWGDIVQGKRVLSVEDVGKVSKQEWAQIYAFIKEQSGNAAKLLDAKYGGISNSKVRLATTGSSNYRVQLDKDDRRFFCLEPAHRDPDEPNEPLSKDDVQYLGQLMRDEEYSQELQEFMDHINFIYQQPITLEEELELYERAPYTKYKAKWAVESKGYISRIVESVPYPDQLHSLMRIEDMSAQSKLTNLYTYLLYMYYKDTGKVGLSWNWFAEIISIVDADEHRKTPSKKSTADALGIDDWSPNIGSRYKLPLNHGLPEDMTHYKDAGLVLSLTEEAATRYKELIEELRPSFNGNDGLEPNII